MGIISGQMATPACTMLSQCIKGCPGSVKAGGQQVWPRSLVIFAFFDMVFIG
jgi:hypothetical protein